MLSQSGRATLVRYATTIHHIYRRQHDSSVPNVDIDPLSIAVDTWATTSEQREGGWLEILEGEGVLVPGRYLNHALLSPS